MSRPSAVVLAIRRNRWALSIDGSIWHMTPLAQRHANPEAARLRRARLFHDAADNFTSVKAEWFYGPEWGYAYTQALYETLFGRRGLGPKGNPDPFNPPQWQVDAWARKRARKQAAA